jgi:TonB family protein
LALSIQLKKIKPLTAETGSQSVRFLNIYYKQDRSLLPYLCLSCLAIAIFQGGLFFYKNLFYKERKDKLTQLIDIELVSQADFKDKKNLLPASVPKPSLAKKTSPVRQSKGQLFTDPVFVIRAGSSENKQKEVVEEEQAKPVGSIAMVLDKNDLSSRYMPLSVPFSKTYSPMSVKSAHGKKDGKSGLAMDMEEVKPPELVEVTENEGDNSSNSWQDGGSSNQGTGISSSLTEYLKDLHRKLKHAWSPPPGTVHHIKVIFRLDTNGSLVSTKLIQSSGNSVADDSAVAAIKKAAPFGELPGDYPHEFLDLAYTFNYTTDELSEINREKED